MTDMRQSPLLSIVVPVFNEGEVIPRFVDELMSVVGPMACTWELIFIDDGSTDDTLGVIRGIQARVSEVFVVRLARNFGKEAAVGAGLDASAGRAVVVMDADLQDPPALIPAFVARWRAGAQVVYGARRDRGSDAWMKRTTARSFYRMFNRLADRPIPPDAGDFRLLDRQVVDVLQLMPERARFMKGLFAWPGFRVESVPFDRPARAAGDSKWPGRRLLGYGVGGIFNFSRLPLRAWAYAGAAIFLLGAIFAAVVVLRAIVGVEDVPGYASLVVLVTTLAGLQICGIGIVGEYVGKTLEEAKGRPLYVVAESDVQPPLVTTFDDVRRPEVTTFLIAKKAEEDHGPA